MNRQRSVVKRIGRYETLLSKGAALRARLQDAEQAIVQFKLQHVRKHPLTEATKAALRGRIAKGERHQGLCCESGEKWMRTTTDLDSIWLEIINHWAYEALSCSQTRPEDIADHVERFGKACLANTWGIEYQ